MLFMDSTALSDMHKRKEAIGDGRGEGERLEAECKREEQIESYTHTQNLKAFVRLKKRNRLNYYFVCLPFWELYLKL